MNVLAAFFVVCSFVGGAIDEVDENGLVGARVGVIAGDASSDGDLEVVGAALRARGLVLLDDDERHGLDGVDDPIDGDRERARTHLMAARAAWRQLDVERASINAGLAIDEVLRLARPDEHLDLLADALVFAAALRLNDNNDDLEGQRLLRLAARLEPARETLDPALHPPSRVLAWQRARSDNAAADTAVVVVSPRVVGDTIDVEVVVDGAVVVPQGGLLQLRRGPHLLTVRGAGASSHSRIVGVEGDGVVIDDVVQRNDNLRSRAALVARLRAGDRTVLPALLSAADTDVIVALDVDGANLGLRRGGMVTVIDADPADPAAFASAVIDALDVPTPAIPTTSPALRGEEAPPEWLIPVVGIIVGVVVVGSAAGIVGFEVWPTEEQASLPRPVVVTCCVQ